MPKRVYAKEERRRPLNATPEEAVRLHVLEHYSFAQIGRLWNVSKQRVKQLFDIARERQGTI